MRQPPPSRRVTLVIPWQRLLAALLTLLAVGVLLHHFILRPAFSRSVGRVVSERVSAEVADVLAAAVVVELHAPEGARAEPAPSPLADSSVSSAGDAATAQQPPTLPPPQPTATATPAPAESRAVLGAIAEGMAATAPAAVAAPTPTNPGAREAQAPADGGAPAAPPVGGNSPVYPTPVVATPIASPDQRSIREIVEDLPQGEITVTDEKLNGKIAGRLPLGPIERIVVRFVPGAVQVTLTAFGHEALASSGLGVAEGRLVVRDPQLSGPLGLLISPEALVQPIEEELNRTLDVTSRQLHEVRIEQGQIVVTLS